MGTAIGWSGPALSLLRSNDSVRNDEFPGVLSQTFDIGDAAFDYVLGEGDVHVSDVDASLIASLMPVGALVGGSSCGFFIGRYGRRTTMFFLTLGFALSYLFLVAASGVWSLFAGRFLTGFCTGAVSVAAPVYVAETASIRVRGTLGSGVQVRPIRDGDLRFYNLVTLWLILPADGNTWRALCRLYGIAGLLAVAERGLCGLHTRLGPVAPTGAGVASVSALEEEVR